MDAFLGIIVLFSCLGSVFLWRRAASSSMLDQGKQRTRKKRSSATRSSAVNDDDIDFPEELSPSGRSHDGKGGSKSSPVSAGKRRPPKGQESRKQGKNADAAAVALLRNGLAREFI